MKSLDRNQRAYRTVMSWPSRVLVAAVDLAQGYPIELRASGTMQALAFSMGKNEPGHAAMAEAIAGWVLSPESSAPLGAAADDDRTAAELLRRLAQASRSAYVAADSEAVAFADAIKLIGKAIRKAAERSG